MILCALKSLKQVKTVLTSPSIRTWHLLQFESSWNNKKKHEASETIEPSIPTSTFGSIKSFDNKETLMKLFPRNHRTGRVNILQPGEHNHLTVQRQIKWTGSSLTLLLLHNFGILRTQAPLGPSSRFDVWTVSVRQIKMLDGLKCFSPPMKQHLLSAKKKRS